MRDTSYENYYSFRDFLTQTYSAVGLGLLISAGVAFLFNLALPLIFRYFGSIFSVIMLVGIAGELGIAVYFTARLYKMSLSTAWTCYVMYAVMTGLSLSLVVLGYSYSSVTMAFLTTAVLFVCMSIIGHTTHIDLTKYGSLFSCGLIAMIIVSLVNAFFIHSPATDLMLTYVGIILFLGLIAFDMQNLRYIYQMSLENYEVGEKMMIYGAFQLYLDFINLFLRILRLFGRRRD